MLGAVNTVVKPVLVVLTLPLTLMTLGVFYLIVNGAAFTPAAWLVPGFEFRSLGWAMLGAALVGLVSMFIGGFRQATRRTRIDVIEVTVRRD